MATPTEDTPPSTDCIVVVISGGGTGSAGGIIPGTVVVGGGSASQLPGAAPADSPERARCMAAAYRSWEQMEAGCSILPIYYERAVCKEANRRLYNNEIAYCNSIP